MLTKFFHNTDMALGPKHWLKKIVVLTRIYIMKKICGPVCLGRDVIFLGRDVIFLRQ